MKTNCEAREERIRLLRLRTEDRFLARRERLEAKAAPMVGELASGKYYAWPLGGKYFESPSHTEVVEHLIRNKYV